MTEICNTRMCTNGIRAQCSSCKTARYCSAACQHTDWPGHKKICAVLTDTFRLDTGLASPQRSAKAEPRQVDTQQDVKVMLTQLFVERARTGAAKANGYRADEARRLDAVLTGVMTPEQREAVQTRLLDIRDTLAKTFTAGFMRSEDNLVSIEEGIRSAMEQYFTVRDQILALAAADTKANEARWLERERDIFATEVFRRMLDETRAEIAMEPDASLPSDTEEQINGCLDDLRARFGDGDETEKDDKARETTTRTRRAAARVNAATADRLGRDDGTTRRLMDKMDEEQAKMTTAERYVMAKKMVAFSLLVLVAGGGYLAIRHRVLADAALASAKTALENASETVGTVDELISRVEGSVGAANAIQVDSMSMIVDRGKIIETVLSQSNSATSLTVNAFKGMLDSILSSARTSLDAAARDPLLNPAKYDTPEPASIKVVADSSFDFINELSTQLRNATTMLQLKEVAHQYNNNLKALSGLSLTDLVGADTAFKKNMEHALGAITETKVQVAELRVQLEKVTQKLSEGITKAELTRSVTPVSTAIARMVGEKLFLGAGGVTLIASTILRDVTAFEATFGSFAVDISAAARGLNLWGLGAAFGTLAANLATAYLTGEMTGLFNTLFGVSNWMTSHLERFSLSVKNSLDATGDGDGVLGKVALYFYYLVSGIRMASAPVNSAFALTGMTMSLVKMSQLFASTMFALLASALAIQSMASTATAIGTVAAVVIALWCSARSPTLASLIAPCAVHLMNYGVFYGQMLTVFVGLWTLRSKFSGSEWASSSSRLVDWLKSTAPTAENVFAASRDIDLTQLFTAKNTLATKISLMQNNTPVAEELLGVGRAFAAGVELKTL